MIKAETLIETIIASVVLSISLVFTIVIADNILLSRKENIQMHALEDLNRSFINIEREKNDLTRLPLSNDFIIKKYEEEYNKNLNLVTIVVFDKDSSVVASSKILEEND